MTKFIDEGYVDLDKEIVRRKDGTRLTEKDAQDWSEEIAARKGRGRPSLSSEGKRSPQLGVRVSDKTLSKLNARAVAEGKKVSEVVREAIEKYV